MLSKAINRTKVKQKHQPTRKYAPKNYPEKAPRNTDIDYILARKVWESRYHLYRAKDAELKKAYSEDFNWFMIGAHIIKMLRLIKKG
tara:strand:- start:107 stop:367 length:261 start_codon:yes stop_codon:yes gene_type:complete